MLAGAANDWNPPMLLKKSLLQRGKSFDSPNMRGLEDFVMMGTVVL